MTSSTQFQNTTLDNSQSCFYMPPTGAVRSEITAFANKAENLANQVLSQDAASAYTGPVIIRDHHYYHADLFFWPMYQPNPRVVVISQSSSSSSKKGDNTLIVAAAVIVGGIALYALGSGIAAYQDASQEFDDTQAFQNKLVVYQRSVNEKEQALVAEATQAAHLKERICSRIKNSAVADIVLRTGLLASCGAIAAGAMTTPAILTAGLIAGSVSVGGMLFKWGFDSSDKANMRDAHSLKGSVQVLSQL